MHGWAWSYELATYSLREERFVAIAEIFLMDLTFGLLQAVSLKADPFSKSRAERQTSGRQNDRMAERHSDHYNPLARAYER